ncbi:hypothetical protein FRC12_023635 [Ceratobasidium sp. 428]|nr:hypothetical protein FRC12_023635 [Ceratobasidium sp. 428]
MGDDCSTFFAAIRDSLYGLRRLKITLWSDLSPNNVDVLFDSIMNTLPALQFLECLEVRTWAEYGINHPSHVSQCTRRALFDLWKALCPSLVRVSAIERHSWIWHVGRPRSAQPSPRPTPPPPIRSNSDPDNILNIQNQRPLPPRPRPASGDWVKESGRWDWKPTGSPLAQTTFSNSSSLSVVSPIPSTSLNPGLSVVVEPVSRGTTPEVYRSPQAGGSWVRAREGGKSDDESLTWKSDLQIMGSTYQRNWQDEHYLNAARSSQLITFAVPQHDFQ